MVDVHILNVGFGSMALVIFPDSTIYVIDCNITRENQLAVLGYVSRIIGRKKPIDVFVNTHRDADHMRGISTLHKNHPIRTIRDNDVPGTTTTSAEYKNYMDLRRNRYVTTSAVEPRKYIDYGEARIQFLNSSWDDYDDPNDQSVVCKIDYKGSSILFTGDTSFRPWQEKILPFYKDSIASTILVASHHGSTSFFDDPSNTEHWYVDHIRRIAPDISVVSVGNNNHDLPNAEALALYEKYSEGSNKGGKIFTTQVHLNMKITLKGAGAWSINVKQ